MLFTEAGSERKKRSNAFVVSTLNIPVVRLRLVCPAVPVSGQIVCPALNPLTSLDGHDFTLMAVPTTPDRLLNGVFQESYNHFSEVRRLFFI